MSIIDTVFISFVVTILWLTVCNFLTYYQRLKVIEDMFDNPYVYFNHKRISYEKHMFRLFTFRWNWRSWYYEN